MHASADDDVVAELLSQVQIAVGNRLRVLRERRHLSQDEVASYAGVHQSEWSRLEAGEIDPRLSWLLRAQRLLEIESVETLLGPLPSRRALGGNGDGNSPTA
jgi:transcriptional regulator with XRE-family HTH domain